MSAGFRPGAGLICTRGSATVPPAGLIEEKQKQQRNVPPFLSLLNFERSRKSCSVCHCGHSACPACHACHERSVGKAISQRARGQARKPVLQYSQACPRCGKSNLPICRCYLFAVCRPRSAVGSAGGCFAAYSGSQWQQGTLSMPPLLYLRNEKMMIIVQST